MLRKRIKSKIEPLFVTMDKDVADPFKKNVALYASRKVLHHSGKEQIKNITGSSYIFEISNNFNL